MREQGGLKSEGEGRHRAYLFANIFRQKTTLKDIKGKNQKINLIDFLLSENTSGGPKITTR